MEEGRKVHEVLDLGYGKCKMCVCGYKDAAPLLQHHELIRVATKYPNIAKDYFYNKKHQTVEIIKLNGSIELAPIVGLSESLLILWRPVPHFVKMDWKFWRKYVLFPQE